MSTVEVVSKHGEWPLTLFFRVEDECIECIGYQIGTTTHNPDVPPLNHLANRFPLSQHITTAIRTLAPPPSSRRAQGDTSTIGNHRPRARYAPGGSGRRGRPPLTADFLEEVARFYNLRSSGRTPTKDVADEWQVSHTAAAKWVFRARKAGLLPPARKNPL